MHQNQSFGILLFHHCLYHQNCNQNQSLIGSCSIHDKFSWYLMSIQYSHSCHCIKFGIISSILACIEQLNSFRFLSMIENPAKDGKSTHCKNALHSVTLSILRKFTMTFGLMNTLFNCRNILIENILRGKKWIELARIH